MAWPRPLCSKHASSVSPNISSYFPPPPPHPPPPLPTSRTLSAASLAVLSLTVPPPPPAPSSCFISARPLAALTFFFLPSRTERASMSLHVSSMRTLHRLKLMSSPSLSELGKGEKSSPEDRGEKQKRAGANAKWNRYAAAATATATQRENFHTQVAPSANANRLVRFILQHSQCRHSCLPEKGFGRKRAVRPQRRCPVRVHKAAAHTPSSRSSPLLCFH